MSADRFTIDTDDGIFIQHPFAANMTVPQMFEGAIRQQARDLELLTNMLHDQRLVIDDLEHRRGKVCDENDQLRADLAAAVAERDRMAQRIKDLDAECSVIAKDCTYAEQQNDTLRARLAAIDAAPTVGWLRPYGRGLSTSEPSGERMPQYELIARPAKD